MDGRHRWAKCPQYSNPDARLVFKTSLRMKSITEVRMGLQKTARSPKSNYSELLEPLSGRATISASPRILTMRAAYSRINVGTGLAMRWASTGPYGSLRCVEAVEGSCCFEISEDASLGKGVNKLSSGFNPNQEA